MLQMKLKSFSIFFSLLIVLSSPSLKGEEEINIWKKKDKTQVSNTEKLNEEKENNKIDFSKTLNVNNNQNIKIEDNLLDSSNEINVFGVYDPSDYNFNLNMWSETKAEDVRASLKRIKKIKLSKTSSEILENVLLSFSYPPDGMNEKEFVNLKIDWLINNNRVELIEDFLKRNREFNGKKRLVQYLVDENIAQANIKSGCEKIKFIDSTIKDSYLEKFKIYCLVFEKKNSQAQLLLDLLREQKKSDNFFDDKINFILGITQKTSNKINEDNLLNFYLSSITIKNFKYEPTKKTKKEIWKYLNAANLIKLEDVNNKQKIRELEMAANSGQINESIIFNIYQQKPFELNTLINAKDILQTLDDLDARALIYQKYLLSENTDSKIEYLFILEDLFKKNKLHNVYSKFFVNELKKIEPKNIPKEYQEIAALKISSSEELIYGKVKYNDKVFHQSKIIKFYVENEPEKKTQKEIDKVFKKINKNKKYFYSAKDLALVNTLINDGFKIPSYFKYNDLAAKYEVPENLNKLIQNKQNAFLALKIVEIIGEDEPHQLDPETVFFITNLLNKTNLIEIRNKVLISALPLRV